ncbi:MAG: flagellar hook-associated protein FlgL, partial [Defluviitaleaceae bacterium]|nr:flagellar hook-associated protein FlgL [Defluviitaleaceae bacterium]
MRVTQSMIFGNSMNNVWRNTRHLNKLVTQIETGVRFQRPSDDPLNSARTMRYRTILAETEQFVRNVQNGLAWMEMSESTFKNVTQRLLQDLNVLVVEGATGTLTLSDKMAIIKEMRQYIEQIGQEMNQTFLGRYVFSGFRTDQPPVFKANNNYSFVITQQFNSRDFERIQSFQRDITPPPP